MTRIAHLVSRIAIILQPKAKQLKRQNKISFLKYLIIGIPVFAALGLVAFALREFGIDGHVSAAEFICFAVAAVMTDWLTKRIYSKKEISKKA